MKGLLALLMAIMMVFLLVACGETKTEDTITEDTLSADTKRVAIADDCWEHVTNLNVVEQGDGTVEVTLTAPDYVSLVKLLAGENNDTISSEYIEKAVNNNPNCVKKYTFTASSSAETDVKNALMEEISYELVALTLEDMIGG